MVAQNIRWAFGRAVDVYNTIAIYCTLMAIFHTQKRIERGHIREILLLFDVSIFFRTANYHLLKVSPLVHFSIFHENGLNKMLLCPELYLRCIMRALFVFTQGSHPTYAHAGMSACARATSSLQRLLTFLMHVTNNSMYDWTINRRNHHALKWNRAIDAIMSRSFRICFVILNNSMLFDGEPIGNQMLYVPVWCSTRRALE